MKESETTEDSTLQTGPGNRLRQARIAQKIEITTIAEHLHMTVAVVRALEEDNYSELPTRVFVRGYLRNYARLVGEPADDILAAFNRIWPPAEQPVKIQPPPRLAADTHPKHRWRQIVTWSLLLLGTLLFLLWWQGYLNQAWQQHTQSAVPANQLPDPLRPPAASLQAPADQPPLSEPVLQTVSPAEPILVPEAIDNALISVPEPEPTPEATIEDLVAEEGMPVNILPVVTIRFNQTCWVDIRDNSGNYQLTGRMVAGEQHQFGGEAPYQLVIGNATAAELSINGEPYDMSPHIRGNVARFTLTPPTP